MNEILKLHDAFPRWAEDDVSKDLNEERWRFTATSRVLPLTEPAEVGQQVAERHLVDVWQLAYEPVELNCALILPPYPCCTRLIDLYYKDSEMASLTR